MVALKRIYGFTAKTRWLNHYCLFRGRDFQFVASQSLLLTVSNSHPTHLQKASFYSVKGCLLRGKKPCIEGSKDAI